MTGCVSTHTGPRVGRQAKVRREWSRRRAASSIKVRQGEDEGEGRGGGGGSVVQRQLSI